jgi:hypothetical protein
MQLSHYISRDLKLVIDNARLEGAAFVGDARIYNGQAQPLYDNFVTLNDPASRATFVIGIMQDCCNYPEIIAASGAIAGALSAWGNDPQETLAGLLPTVPFAIALPSKARIEVSDVHCGDDGRLNCTLVKCFPDRGDRVLHGVVFDNGAVEEKVRDALGLDRSWWVEIRERIRESAGYSANSANTANWGWEPPSPFVSNDVPPYPTGSLPPRLRELVVAVALFTQTPPDLAAQVALAALSAAVRGRAIVSVKPGYVEPLNIWTITVLGPGNRKSAVFKTITAPLIAYERREAKKLASEIAKAQSTKRVNEGRLARLQQVAATKTGDEARTAEHEARDLAITLATDETPTAPQLIVDDITPERLTTVMAEQGGAIAIMSAEGGVFDLMGGRYAKGMPNLDVYLKGHAGDDLRVNRQGREPVWIANPALTLGITVQPEVLRGAASRPEFRGRGLLGRPLYALPLSLLGHRDTDPPPIPEEVTTDWGELIDGILTLDGDTEDPHILEFDPVARPLMYVWEKEIERELGDSGTLSHMPDWGGKLFGATARIAGLLHFARRGALAIHGPIDAETTRGAITIARYLIDHAITAFAELGADPQIEDARQLLRAIERHGTHDAVVFTKRTLFEWAKGRFKRVEDLDAPLRLIIAHGYIREQESETRPGPGRKPSPTYETNPHWIGSQYSHNAQNGAG